MKISFSGFENPIHVAEKGITVLRIRNATMFARVCESIVSLKGTEAIEPYSVWDKDGHEINPSNAFIVVSDPFSLPWKHRCMLGALHSRLESDLLFDEELRQEIQHIGLELESAIHKLAFQNNANYRFGVEWNLSSYLKAFSFEIDVSESASLLEKIISFIDLGADMSIDKVIVFINLKTFLTENDLIMLQNRLFFLGIRAILLENQDSFHFADFEREYVVDRDFVEYVFEKRSDCSSSTQGRFCSNGFGAVTF